MRVVAILATYNEERFIAACLENLFHQGVEVYLCDNESVDETVAIAESYGGSGIIGIETFPRDGLYRWKEILQRKEQLALTLQADWFMHVDADEIRLAPQPGQHLLQAFQEVDAQGFNAVNFMEYAFTPTRESPEHDHPDFQKTMRWYYPYLPTYPHRVNAWKRQPLPVDLASSAGHHARFPGLRLYPESFPMRHYLFLSKDHAIRKFVKRPYDPRQVAKGWDVWRSRLKPEMIDLPSETQLRLYTSDAELDPSDPRTTHFLAEAVRVAEGR